LGFKDADPTDLAYYEGLIFATAVRLEAHVEMEVEDIQQVLRVKAWKALCWFDPARCRTSIDRYVFMCLRDQAKDLVRKRKRGEVFIDDLASDEPTSGLPSRDRFEHLHGLVESHDDVFAAVEDEGVVMPNTLTRLELAIVVLLYRDYRQSEIARKLGLGKPAMERAMRSIRTKLADWKPSAGPSSDRPVSTRVATVPRAGTMATSSPPRPKPIAADAVATVPSRNDGDQ
jgi:DNA-directed RNA polymerase specialized sigma24 family protein